MHSAIFSQPWITKIIVSNEITRMSIAPKKIGAMLPRGKCWSLAKASKSSMDCEESLGQRHMKISMNCSPFPPYVSLPRLLLTTLLRSLVWNYHGNLWPHLTLWPRKNGRFGNETNTLQLRQRTAKQEFLSEVRQRCFRMSRLWTGFTWWHWYHTSALKLHFALWFEAWLHHGNCSKCSIQILVSRHTQNVEAFALHRHDLDGISALVVPATHPWKQQMRFNALAPLFGGEVLGQAVRTEHLTLQTKHVPQKAAIFSPANMVKYHRCR